MRPIVPGYLRTLDLSKAAAPPIDRRGLEIISKGQTESSVLVFNNPVWAGMRVGIQMGAWHGSISGWG